jgi:Pvc16 N-terminal domain
MSDFRAIAGITRTLAAFLQSATGVTTSGEKAPSDTISDATPFIHVYLYRVEQNPAFANNDFIAASDTKLVDPPAGLNLFYLITPYGPDQIEIQRTLGDVIQAFHETPVIPPSAFDPLLTNVSEEIRVFPAPLTLEQMTDLCRCFGQRPYRLATTYEISVVLIDSRVSRDVTRVQERYVGVKTLR